MNYSQLALQLMDLTSLNDDDTNEVIVNLCQQAKTPFGHPAAVCVYPAFIKVARQALDEQGLSDVKVATVTNFPAGKADIDLACQETLAAVEAGADEVDVVFPYQSLMQGDDDIGVNLVRECKTACGDKALLKVIIESGVLQTPELIRKASEQAIAGGADFIKTSTGKVDVNATLEAAKVMLNVIKDSGRKNVGFKAAGGVRTVADAQAYLQLAADIMGEEWISSDTFRFGASGLLNNLLAALNNEDESTHSSY